MPRPKRSPSFMGYYTRALQAQDPRFRIIFDRMGGFEAAAEQAEIDRAAGKRRALPPRPATRAKTPAAEAEHEPTRAELLEQAKELGVELPSGYVKKDELAELVEEAEQKPGESE